MTSLYGLLGVRPDASADEIRRAYYRAARQLHPDVNPRADADADMRRLNRAWAVLSDPVARRRYDAELPPTPPARTRPPGRPAEYRPAGYRPAESPEPGPPRPPRFLRPSALIVIVLLLIFVVTAYAGHVTNGQNSPARPSPSTSLPPASSATSAAAGAGTGARSLLGECLQPETGYDAVVPCGQPNLGEVVMLVAASSQCPADTRPYQLKGQPQWVCLRSSTSG